MDENERFRLIGEQTVLKERAREINAALESEKAGAISYANAITLRLSPGLLENEIQRLARLRTIALERGELLSRLEELSRTLGRP